MFSLTLAIWQANGSSLVIWLYLPMCTRHLKLHFLRSSAVLYLSTRAEKAALYFLIIILQLFFCNSCLEEHNHEWNDTHQHSHTHTRYKFSLQFSSVL